MMRHVPLLLLGTLFFGGCELIDEDQYEGDSAFPLEPHNILPVYFASNGQIATGVVTGKQRALEQPIKFPHYTHATTLEMQCEYCHSSARDSIHGGVPETQVCMNCHKFVKTDVEEIKKVTEFWNKGESIPWQKVHDLPDYVNFSHKRHVRAGVQCQECHGQVQLQGEPQLVTKRVEGEDGHHEEVEVLEVQEVMIRETSLQMGWCLDCHGSHPSIDKNYGDQADLRRAELKDCWTCHK